MFKGGFQTRLRPKETLIDLAPLVDVVFLLLIFFFVTSEILPLKSIPLQPPKLNLEATAIPSEILVLMDRFGIIYVGSHKRVTTLSDIALFLKKELSSTEEEVNSNKKIKPSLLVSVDKEVPYGMFLSLFSTLYQTGYPIRLVFENPLS